MWKMYIRIEYGLNTQKIRIEYAENRFFTTASTANSQDGQSRPSCAFWLLDDLAHDACADGAAAFADGEAQFF